MPPGITPQAPTLVRQDHSLVIDTSSLVPRFSPFSTLLKAVHALSSGLRLSQQTLTLTTGTLIPVAAGCHSSESLRPFGSSCRWTQQAVRVSLTQQFFI